MPADERIAVFSDIHSNLEAFQAVIEDMRSIKLGRMICLGDIVGYAASPKECVELVRSLGCEVLMGNHDLAVIDNPTMLEMREAAAKGILFARQQLPPDAATFLLSLPMTAIHGHCQFVHSSLDHPEAWTYLTREPEIRAHFKNQTQPVAFCGHTHIPAAVRLTPNDEMELVGQRDRIKLPNDGKILINVGAVGQPRDRCPDACYAVYDSAERTIEFRRVAY
ncbi:MAG TPA: metallophosphoesterase family protein, partial [Chthoniobacterales bacterium]